MSDFGKIDLNGSEWEKEAFREKIILNIKKIEKEHHVAFNQLVPICKDPKHKMFWNMWRLLKKYKLINQDETMDDTVRDIILSSITATAPWELIAPIQKVAGQEIKEVLQAEQGENKEDTK